MLMVTVSASLFSVPSLTTRLTTYIPALSTVKVGFTAVVSLNAALLPTGTEVNAQLKINVLPSTSVLPLPSSVTVPFTSGVWSGPAFATGAEFNVLIVTVSAALLTVPSLTMRLTTYVPALSTVKVGFADVELLSAALLPAGTVVNAHV